jgi:pyruvate dehydrogenase E2 component (dihydrolipoamide acetyltransferase)
VAKEIEVLLPDVGDFPAVDVIEILVAPGDRVEVEDSLVVLESDKATLEVPSPQAGRVKGIRIRVGDKVAEGDLLLTLEVDEAAMPPEQPANPVPARPEPETPPVPEAAAAPVPPASAEGKAHASPGVRRFARKLGVDLALVPGTAPKGRVTREDVEGFVQQCLSSGSTMAPAGGLPPLPEVDFSRFGEIDRQPLGRIKKLSGTHLQRCWLNIPHVTQFDEADITELEAFRKAHKETAQRQGVRLTLLPFLIQACAALLKELPEFNSSLAGNGEHLIYKKYIHIGVAVDTPDGLVVPVLRDVDEKGGLELAQELAEVSERARQGRLSPADMQGGCFTISSLGGIGGTAFTPIVNGPEVAILGVSRAAMKPVWDGKAFQPRLMLPLALSYDHRVIDGAQGVRFITRLSELLGDIRRLLL